MSFPKISASKQDSNGLKPHMDHKAYFQRMCALELVRISVTLLSDTPHILCLQF